jgi:hypothetical protein
MRRANEVDHGRHTLTRVVHSARTGTEPATATCRGASPAADGRSAMACLTTVGEDAGLAFLVGSP